MKTLFLLVVVLCFFHCQTHHKTAPIVAISEAKYLEINGTKQFVMINGENDKNPVLLHLPGVSFLHFF